MRQRFYIPAISSSLLAVALLGTACNNSAPQPTALPRPTSAGTQPTLAPATAVPPTPAAPTLPLPTIVQPTPIPPTATPIAQSLGIDTPPPGTLVGSPVVLTGRMARTPLSGQLTYRMDNAAGQQIDGGSFAANGSAFNASLNFTLPSQGGVVRATISDAAEASATLDLFVAAAQQMIAIDSPPPGTQVGSPVVITGRLARTPFQNNLAYRFRNLVDGRTLGEGILNVAITGLLTTLDQSPLPSEPGTVITLRLEDRTRQDVPAVLIAETSISPSARIPLPFELRYNPAQINAANSYVVSAEVRFNGVLLYRTNAQYAVITQGNPTNIVLLMERV